jgi:hypothetical protein
MKRPNFFILGAPKCGTTSMAQWLGEHPAVFMSTPKEPTYFCTDLNPARPRNIEEYEQLFDPADQGHEIVGEASTGYLYSRTAVPNILEYSPDPRFLVMVRNPLEMAPALHGEQLYQGNEHVTDFAEAWALQERRIRDPDDYVRATCRDPQFLMYGPFCRLGEQLKRLYERVSRDLVRVVLLDDVKRDPRSEYLGVLAFLGIADDGRRDFPVLNRAKARRFESLNRMTRALANLRLRIGPSYRGLGILNRISSWNRVAQARYPVTPETRVTLVDYFRDDVEQLEDLLGRDLRAWLTETSAG